MKSPSFQMYPKDFLSSGSVAVMSLSEIGAYSLLLMREWDCEGLPDDMDTLAAWVRVPPSRFAKIWRKLRPCFELRDGRWYHPRLDEEREKQAVWRAKSAAGGRASGRVRRTKGGSRVVEPNTNIAVCSLQSSTPPSPPLPDGNGRGTGGREPTALREIIPPLSPEAAATGRREFEKIANGEAPKPARIQVLPS